MLLFFQSLVCLFVVIVNVIKLSWWNLQKWNQELSDSFLGSKLSTISVTVLIITSKNSSR